MVLNTVDSAKLAPGAVLDVGSGTGYLVRLIAAALGWHGLAIGIDPSTSVVEYARCRGGRSANAHFQVGSAEAVEFADDHFDVVVSSLVMHQMPEDVRIRALFLWLRPRAHPGSESHRASACQESLLSHLERLAECAVEQFVEDGGSTWRPTQHLGDKEIGQAEVHHQRASERT